MSWTENNERHPAPRWAFSDMTSNLWWRHNDVIIAIYSHIFLFVICVKSSFLPYMIWLYSNNFNFVTFFKYGYITPLWRHKFDVISENCWRLLKFYFSSLFFTNWVIPSQKMKEIRFSTEKWLGLGCLTLGKFEGLQISLLTW